MRSGVDGLITTIRDQVDAEVFEAGKGTLKVISQIAVGFDNINRADANRYKVPFTHTPDVLTETTSEFAFFILAALARKLWDSEKLVRENRWDYWHPYLPFVGDEVTGKTIAVIGTGRIGQALIKKCVGFDMHILCYDPVFQNTKFVQAIQEINDLRYKHGLFHERVTIKYVTLEEALAQADYVSIHVPLIRPGESDTPTYHLFNERLLRTMKPTAYLVNTSRGPVVDEAALAKLCASAGSPAPLSTCTRRSRCPPIRRCAIPPSPTAAACFPTSPAPAGSPAFLPIPTKAWPAAACKG